MPFTPWEENLVPGFILRTQWEPMVWGSRELPGKDEPFGTGPQNLLRASEPSSQALGPLSRAPGGGGWPDRPLCLQVCDRPLMFVLDTPGVLSPRIESVEMGLKLALCGESGPLSAPPTPAAGPDGLCLLQAGRLTGASPCSHPADRGPESLRPGQGCQEPQRLGLSGEGHLRAGAGRACGAQPGFLLPGTVLDHLVGEETLADYLLYTLNRHRLFG